MNASTILVLNAIATWYLVGLIWTVQIVHYKLFDRVGEAGFVRYEKDHTRLITMIVGPPMLVEIITAALLMMMTPPGSPRWAVIAAFAIVLAIWLSTVLIQVPCHNRLSSGFDLATYRRLVQSNWIRTILWTIRGLAVGYFLIASFRS
ncbi:hypothetical protein [Planctomycetes bacterium K23_9]|uniref:DUF1772 domain-containing protein n=1 Tax=Stieleria marina TaxID=1930275 RepID=A0A517NYI6_9BACT|nr:hypothetical protein K239x_41970 [Planctomycetes bacterium K23_9]